MSVWLKRALALVIGIVIGLSLGGVLGWVVWPVQYYDTDLLDMRADHQDTYILMVSEQWELTGDLNQARAALSLLSADASQTLEGTLQRLESAGNAGAALRVLNLMEALKRP